MDEKKKWYSVNEIAEHLNVSAKFIYTWVENKRIPAYKIGRVWRFDVEEIDKWVKANRE